MKPLTVGNVVSAGLRIYRDRFFDYFKLAFIGYLWILVPFLGLAGLIYLLNLGFGYFKLILLGFLWFLILIYCMAKYSAILGLISRLTFGEVTEKPESIKDAQRYVKPRMWKFLTAGILVNLIIFVSSIVFMITLSIAIGILSVVLGLNTTAGQDLNPATILITILLSLAGIVLFLFFFTWLISRLLIVEVPLAIEENVNATDAISRGWQLTKGSIFRLQLIILVAFIISFPITIAIQIASSIIQQILGTILAASPELFRPLFFLLTLLIGLAGGALFIPFWQSIKAVIYYDLRVRREGLGLNLEKN